MSSPVQIGTEVLFARRSYWLVYCQGMTSSSQAGLYFSIRSREPDAVVQRDVAEMVDGERDFVADLGAHLRDVAFEQVEALLGEMQSGEGVADVVHVVACVAPPAILERARPACARRGSCSLSRTPVGEPTAPGTCMICASPRSILRKV